MPNYCDYEMIVKGKKENVEEFVRVIKTDYEYDDVGNCKCEAGRHLWRVFEANSDILDIEDGMSVANIWGYCAWSVYSCMFDGDGTYQHDRPNRCGTTLQIESTNLGLEIEVYSKEPGICFMEHYYIDNGEVTINECVDYKEWYTDDYDTVEEMNEACDTHFTQAEFDNADDGYISEGGMDWNFSI